MGDPITFEVRQVDAWLTPEGWQEMNSYKLGVFTTRANDCKAALVNYLKKVHNIRFLPNSTRIFDYGDLIEIIDRKTLIEIIDRKTEMPIIFAVMIDG